MNTCPVLDDKQLTKEISDYLTAEKSSQLNNSVILVSASAFERRLNQKFKCSAELDRKRIIGMLETIVASRNRYLELSAKGRPIQLFTLTSDEQAPVIQPKLLSPKQPSPKLSIPKNLSPCFSGRVQIENQDINTAHWPNGILLVPNFLSESEQLELRRNLQNPSSLSAKFECLSGLFSQYNFSSSVSDKPSIHQNTPHSPNMKINVEGTVILLIIGEVVSFLTNYKGTNINIPLVSGSLLRIDSSLRDLKAEMKFPKNGISFIIQF